MSATTIALINPYTGTPVHRDLTDLTQGQLDAYADVMDDESREQIHDLGINTPAEWLAAWVDLVGPEVAGRVILGS